MILERLAYVRFILFPRSWKKLCYNSNSIVYIILEFTLQVLAYKWIPSRKGKTERTISDTITEAAHNKLFKIAVFLVKKNIGHTQKVLRILPVL